MRLSQALDPNYRADQLREKEELPRPWIDHDFTLYTEGDLEEFGSSVASSMLGLLDLYALDMSKTNKRRIFETKLLFDQIAAALLIKRHPLNRRLSHVDRKGLEKL